MNIKNYNKVFKYLTIAIFSIGVIQGTYNTFQIKSAGPATSFPLEAGYVLAAATYGVPFLISLIIFISLEIKNKK